MSPAKTAFDAMLQSNAEWFEWIECANKFESLLKDKIPWDLLDGQARAFIQSRMKSTAPSRQVMLNSFYLTMVSGFEEFLREKLRETTRNYASNRKRYAEMDEAVRNTHLHESARLLRRIHSPPDYLPLNVEELCRGIGSCVPNSELVLLNADAFADVESLIGLQAFAERVAIFGIKLDLDSLGDDENIKLALSLPRARTREVARALEAELKVLRRNRNRIAHTGGNASDVTVELLKSHRLLLQSVARAIDSIVA